MQTPESVIPKLHLKSEFNIIKPNRLGTRPFSIPEPF